MVIIFLPKLVRHRVVIRRNSFFFLFPFSYRSHFFLQSFGKKFVVEGGDKGSCTRGIVRNEDHFFDGNSRSIIEASYVSPYAGHFPLSFSFFLFPSFPFLFLVDQSWPFSPRDLSLLPRPSSDIELFEWINLLPLNETRTRTPRVHVCEYCEAQTVSRQRKYTRCREGISIRSGKRKF